jgi:uncharacterized protein
MRKIAISLIRLYQKTLSPDHGLFAWRYPDGWCRYQPTCSQYAIEAIEQHGSVRGGWLATRRVSRCHPWGKGGHDPVPTNTKEA